MVFNDQKLQQRIKQLQNELRNRLPKVLAAQAERHFKQSFRDQGFTDRALVRWRPSRGVKAGRTLRRSGLLFNSIRIARADAGGIVIVAGGPYVPYARIHNEGGTIQRQVTRRAHQRKAHRRGRSLVKEHSVRRHQARLNVHLPKRQYMGKSQVLDTAMRNGILNSVQRIMQS